MLDSFETTRWREAWEAVPIGQVVLASGRFFQCDKDRNRGNIFHVNTESIRTTNILGVKVMLTGRNGESIECIQFLKRTHSGMALVNLYFQPDLTCTLGFTRIDISRELALGGISFGTIGVFEGYFYNIDLRRQGNYKGVDQSVNHDCLIVMRTSIKHRSGKNDIPCFVILKKSSEYPDLYAITDRYILPGVGQCEFKETNLSIGGKVEVAQVADLQAGNIGIASCMVYPVQTVSEGGKVVIVEIRDTVPFILFDKIGRVVELKDTGHRVIEILKQEAVSSFNSTGRYYVPIKGRFRVLPSGLLIVR